MRRYVWQLSALLELLSSGRGNSRKAQCQPSRALAAEQLESRALPTASGILSGVAFIDANNNHVKDFIDTNNNQTQDANEIDELVVPGLTLQLKGTDIDGNAVDAKATADSQGKFSFISIPVVANGQTYSLIADPDHTLLAQSVTLPLPSGVGTGTVTQDIGVKGVLPKFVSLRQFSTETVRTTTDGTAPTAFQFASPGTGQIAASDNAPTLRTTGQADTPVQISVARSAAPTNVDLAGVFDDADYTNSIVRFHTTEGDINFQLFDGTSPQTVANFLNYANSDSGYKDIIFSRLVNGFALQGGSVKFDETTHTFSKITADPPVQNEFDKINGVAKTVVHNTVGTIAMAKLGSDPNSATDEFFFNLGDNSNQGAGASNSNNLDVQNGGFTVFGKVLSKSDLDVLTKIQTIKTEDKSASTAFPANFGVDVKNLPLKGYKDKTPTSAFPTDLTAANLVRLTSVETIQQNEKLTYTTSASDNSNTVLVTAAIVNNRLKLTYTTGIGGEATIVVHATDKAGKSTDATIHVVVGLTGNHAPTVSNITFSPAHPSATGSVTANATTNDVDGDNVALKYAWTAKGTPVADQTGQTLNLSGLGLQPGDPIAVQITPNDGLINGTQSASVGTTVNHPPVINSITFDKTALPSLKAVVSTSDTDASDTVTLAYKWSVNEVVNPTTTDTLDISSLTAGDQIKVEVTASDGVDSAISSQTTVV